MKLEWNTCLKIVVSVFLGYLCITYWPAALNLFGLIISAALPLLVGCVVAYLVNILMSFYEKYYFPHSQKKLWVKSRRPVCLIGAFLTIFAVIFLVIWLVVPQLVACVEIILSGVPKVLQEAVALIEEYKILPENSIAALEEIDWNSKINQIIQVLTYGVGSVMDVMISTLSSVFSWIVSGLLSFIFAIYLLSGKETLGRQYRKLLNRYVKTEWINRCDELIEILNTSFHNFIVGQCLEAVILGLLCTLGMVILKLPYATMIGALMAFTALIPVAGAWIGGGVGAIMILTVSPIQAVIFLIYIVVLQQVETNLIYPRVVGSSMGLPGIWVLAAVTIGGGVMGMAGMLLSVPLAASVYRILQKDVNKLPIDNKETE